VKFLNLLFLFILPTQILAVLRYTPEEVVEHDTSDDCWMIFEDKVYNFTEYLPEHDEYMDIREWCGQDMTEDFKTKVDIGRDHKSFSYQMLDDYYIAELQTTPSDPDAEVEITAIEQNSNEVKPSSLYNLVLPLFITLLAYWGSYFIFKKRNILKFNAFWNTLLLITFLVPSFGFGIYMMLQYKFPSLREVNFDFMYWHVELSIVMGAIAMSHFIQRFKQYLVQLRK